MRISPCLASILIAATLLPASALLAQNAIRPSTAANGGGAFGGGGAGAFGGGGGARAGGGAASGAGGSATRDYRNATMLGDAIVNIDEETRSIIVVADDDTQKEVENVIRNLDQPKPQVLIKVLFAQVTLDKDLDFGVEGNYSFTVGSHPLSQALSGPIATTASTITNSVVNAITGGTATTTTTTSNSTPTTVTTSPIVSGVSTNYGLASETTGSFLRINTASATATLFALAQKGDVNILSRPSILARNNQQAVIVVGQEVPLITNSQITTDGATINTVQYQDVGIILRVTPFISTGRSVEMIVSPEISSLSSQTVSISPTVNAPVINKTSAETVVVTPDGQTVVIGGMMQKQQTSSIDKVPILGDIPLLGNAFRHTVKADEKVELLIFLTPYIVEGTGNLGALSTDELNRTDLQDTALKGNDMTRYLDSLPIAPPPRVPAPVPVQVNPHPYSDPPDASPTPIYRSRPPSGH